MKTVKLGRFTLPDYAAEKPVGIRSSGQLIYAKDLLENKVAPSFGLALAPKENKTKLALERIKLEPDFEFGVMSRPGKYSKNEVLKHIEDQTSLGLVFTDIEVNYAEYFTQQLLGNIAIPKVLSLKEKADLALPKIPAEWKWLPKAYWRFLKARVLFCENTTDGVTSQAAQYRIANVHKAFANRGFEVICLDGVNDIRTNFITKSTEPRVVYIGGIGHGNYTTYTGHMFNHILEVGAYGSNEVNGKVIHFLSCETGRTLGPDTVTHAARAYVGYDENFVFDWANSNLYWKCDSQFDISMANGKSVEQAIADTYAQYDAAITSVPGTSTASTLLNDKNLLRSPVSGPAWGSKTAKVYPYAFYHIPVAQYMDR
jgi:hypothetical protein